MAGAKAPWKPRARTRNCWLNRFGPAGEIMILHKCLLGSAAMIAVLAQSAAAAPWQRGFVVGTYGFAFHYGSRPSAAATDAGADCPHGSSVHFSDEVNMRKALEQQPWRSKLEINNIIK